MKERIFLTIDEYSLKEDYQAIRDLVPEINKTLDLYALLGIGEVNQDFFHRVIVEQDLHAIENSVIEMLCASKEDIEDQNLSDEFKKTAWQMYHLLRTEVYKLGIKLRSELTSPPRMTFEAVEIINGVAVLPEKPSDLISEKYKIYAETEREFETYKLILQLKEAWDSLHRHIMLYGKPGFRYDIYDFSDGFVAEDEAGFLVPLFESVKYLHDQLPTDSTKRLEAWKNAIKKFKNGKSTDTFTDTGE